MRNKYRLLVIILFACICTGSNAASPVVRRLMELPPFERAVLIIKHYETLHRPEHWPTVAYGHVVKKGERYLKRQYSHAEADLILRKDLAGLCARYRVCGRDSLLLACLAYNVGTARVQDSSVLRKLRSGDRDIQREYASFSRYRGRRHPGLYRRRLIELELLYTP